MTQRVGGQHTQVPSNRLNGAETHIVAACWRVPKLALLPLAPAGARPLVRASPAIPLALAWPPLAAVLATAIIMLLWRPAQHKIIHNPFLQILLNVLRSRGFHSASFLLAPSITNFQGSMRQFSACLKSMRLSQLHGRSQQIPEAWHGCSI